MRQLPSCPVPTWACTRGYIDFSAVCMLCVSTRHALPALLCLPVCLLPSAVVFNGRVSSEKVWGKGLLSVVKTFEFAYSALLVCLSTFVNQICRSQLSTACVLSKCGACAYFLWPVPSQCPAPLAARLVIRVQLQCLLVACAHDGQRTACLLANHVGVWHA